MDSYVALAANHQGFASACCHSFDPGWSFFPAFFVQVCKFTDVMDFNILTRAAYLAFIRQ